MRILGPADAAFFVIDLVTELAYAEREILILSESVGTETSATFDQVSTPGADRSRNYRDAVQTDKSAAIHILCSDIFQRLPPRDDVYAVADLGVTSDSTHLW